MKKFNFYLSFLAVFALLFTSCSKDEDSGVNPDSDKATLSFGAIVQDLANKSTNKQSDIGDEIGDMPECTDDTAAYVEIVLMQGENEVVGTTTEPFRVDLVAGQLFTEEVPELELTPGSYSLAHFAVYNEEGTLIWLAPKGGELAQFVDNPLPLDINLGAGVKKYVEVDVICYDDRDVNQYGYQFFELDLNEAFEYCFFANYCTPEGRHFPARYSVDISIDGELIYSGEVNTTGTHENGDLYAEPLCLALPDLEEFEDDVEYIDYTLTLLDWEAQGAYGDVEPMEISGSLSRAEIMANFDGDEDVDYEHLRFGCGDDGEEPDSDNDGVIDSIDECANTPEGTEVNSVGCPVEDNDTDDDSVVNSNDNCPDVANEDQTNTDGDALGNACDPDDDNDTVNDDVDNCPLEAGSAANNGCPVQETDTDGDEVIDTSDNCPTTPNEDQADSDDDGLGNVCDSCPDETGPASNNGCPEASECVIDALDNAETCASGITPPDSDPDYSELGNFFEIGGNIAIPILEDTGSSFAPSIGTVGVEVSGSSLSVTLDPISTLYFTDYKIEVTDTQGGTVTCVTGVDLAEVNNGDAVDYTIDVPGSFSYPIFIRVVSNECPVTP